ncbi:hypothetical protein EVAR_58104_1 [Eumeta japonica]|uniref:Uncharacterized protein n=1 Tax=Eumeta variegata TaxID=151549 RepID=A0A4C1YKE1_EUMVA|nr:hypothetical protein EVAR_58104_1 [Eumeta japonica]
MVSPLAPQEAGVDVFLISFLSQCLNQRAAMRARRGVPRRRRGGRNECEGVVCPLPPSHPGGRLRAPAAVSLRHTSLTTYRVKRKEILISLLGGDGNIADKTENAAVKLFANYYNFQNLFISSSRKL